MLVFAEIPTLGVTVFGTFLDDIISMKKEISPKNLQQTTILKEKGLKVPAQHSLPH